MNLQTLNKGVEIEAERLLRYAASATGADGGARPWDDPVVKAVTEGRSRASGRVYSSCGDLPHWFATRLGVREPWVNRDEVHGWKAQVNIGRLTAKPWGSRGDAVQLTLQDPPPTFGDILVVEATNPRLTHTFVVLAWEPDGRGCLGAHYGQPGAKLKWKEVSQNAVNVAGSTRGLWRVGSRNVYSCLRFRDLCNMATAELETVDEYAARLALPAPVALPSLDNPSADTP